MPPHLLVMPEGTTTTTITNTNTVTSPFSSAASLLPAPPQHCTPASYRIPKAKCFILPSVPPVPSMHAPDDPLHGSFVSDGLDRPVARVRHIVRIIDAPDPAHPHSDHTSDTSFTSADDAVHGPMLHAPKPAARVYDFDDDFPSIGASESTHPRSRGVRAPDEGFKDREGSAIVGSWEEVEFGRGASVSFGNGSRASFASSLRRRVSWCQTREDKMRSRLKKGGVEDSVVRDFRQARLRTSGIRDNPASAEAKGRGRGGTPEGKGGTRIARATGKWGFTSWLSKVWKKRDDDDDDDDDDQDGHDLQHGAMLGGGARDAGAAGVMVDDRKMEDMQFISMLAYDEFMHSPNRSSPMAKVFSRLRRG